MKQIECDVVILGGGSAGLSAYSAAAAEGVNCVLVESGPLGTTAQRTGDLPSNTLMGAAMCAHSLKNFSRYGLKLAPDFMVDTTDVLNTLRTVRARATNEVLSFMYRIPEDRRIIGKASFEDDHHLIVGDEYAITFKCAVVATGSSPIIPYELFKLGGVLTTNEIFELDALPRRLAVFGTGAIGLQLGQALSYLGLEVTVFGDNYFWDLTDESVLNVASDLMQARFGVAVNSHTTAIERSGSGYGIYYLDGHQYENYLSVDAIVATASRFPRTEGLNLREIGVEITSHGFVKVDPATMQTSLPHLFAAGDVANPAMNTISARLDGRVAGRNAACFPSLTRQDHVCNYNLAFTDPPMAIVGLSLDRMKERARAGFQFNATELRLNDGRYRSDHVEGGIIKIYTDENSHELLGAEMCAPQADHLASFLSLAMHKHMTVDELAEFSFYQPTYEEAIAKAASYAVRALKRKQGDNFVRK